MILIKLITFQFRYVRTCIFRESNAPRYDQVCFPHVFPLLFFSFFLVFKCLFLETEKPMPPTQRKSVTHTRKRLAENRQLVGIGKRFPDKHFIEPIMMQPTSYTGISTARLVYYSFIRGNEPAVCRCPHFYL